MLIAHSITYVAVAFKGLALFGALAKCSACLLQSNLRSCLATFNSQCTGPDYQNHRVRNIHGLNICWGCGAPTTTGIIKAKLGQRCLKVATGSSLKALNKVKDDLLLPGRGLSQWPNGTPQRESAKVKPRPKIRARPKSIFQGVFAHF